MSVTVASVSAGAADQKVDDHQKVDDKKKEDDKARKDRDDKARKDRDDKARKDRDDKARKDRDDKKRHDDKFKPKGHWKIIKVKHVAWKHGHKFVWFTVKKVFVFNHFNGHFR
jgi:hypothetical protein